MKRRDFIVALLTLPLIAKFDSLANNEIVNIKNKLDKSNNKIFENIINLSRKENWQKLNIGNCVSKVGLQLVGTPYKASTLEGNGVEKCRINLTGMDCVTFFEASLCIARTIKKGKSQYQDFVNEVIFSRYRQGKITNYTSRLHYTSDWIYDNIQKGVVKDLTKEIGGEKIKFHLDFMSKHPQYYKALESNPKFIAIMKEVENKINKRTYYYIPKNQINKFVKYFRTGDIVAFVTNISGLDYSHTGLLYRDIKNVVRLLDASSIHKKVVIDKPIHQYIENIQKDIGITVVRPIF